MNKYFTQLKMDYDSSNNPSVRDPKTVETLKNIRNEIHLKRISEKEVMDFIDKNLETGDFAENCKRLVKGDNKTA